MTTITYAEGGYDPAKPDNNVAAAYTLHDDGTVTVTADGKVATFPATDATIEQARQAKIDTNRATLADKARAALDTNRAYLALGTTTTAQDKAQLKALTRECSALIRSVYDLLDALDGT